ncbi:DnaB-like helicase C-terminal domain-containing protein [Scatolibacter rhodanostii]|uniref:DnaB-like helicase C-terminal domain-containing protein n=1 Tax=Scatolibacter rhodanostii TaxID=2014781 RepID=UPI000C07878B|nr:DnaB-like helicase C-terminal domain-containing protein [Scatolibacter rhodanostii]
MSDSSKQQIPSNPFELKILSGQVSRFTKDKIKTLAKPKIATGFKKLDTILGGGLFPGLTVLGAITGLGKSTLLLQIAEYISSNDTPVIYFSLEMPSLMIAAKAISRQLFCNVHQQETLALTANELTSSQKDGFFKTDTWKQIEKARNQVEKNSQNLMVEDSQFQESGEELTAEKIYTMVSDYIKVKEKQPVVIVDYLQIIAPDTPNSMGSEKQNVDRTVKWMTRLAKDFDIPVVVISSLNRAAYNQKVKIESFKETGGIEYSADVVLGLSFSKAPEFSTLKSKFSLSTEKGKTPREVELTALKQRYGSSGASSSVKMHYYAKYDYFTEDISKKKSSAPEKISPAEQNFNNAEKGTTR